MIHIFHKWSKWQPVDIDVLPQVVVKGQRRECSVCGLIHERFI